MSTAAPAAAKRPQYDPARAAYQRSRNAEVRVKGYVGKMNIMPAPRFVRAQKTA